MTGIGSINGVFGASPTGSAIPDARQAAQGAIGEIGHRVLAWVGASGGSGGGGSAAWSASTGAGSGFRPDPSALARGGDIYGLGELGGELAAQFGGTPAEEGALGRALEGFTREAVIQLAGLSGAPAERQLAGIEDALTAAGGDAAPSGIDGLTQRITTATAALARQNGD